MGDAPKVMQNLASPQKAPPTSGTQEKASEITPHQTPVKSPVPKKTKVGPDQEGTTGGDSAAAEDSMDTRPTLDLEEADELAPEEQHEADDRRLVVAGIFANNDEHVSKCEGELKELASWAEKVLVLLAMGESERSVQSIQFRLVDPDAIFERLESASESYQEAMALNGQLLEAISARASSITGIQAVVDDKIAKIKTENWSDAWMAKKIAGIEFWGQEAAKRFHQKVADLDDAYKQFVETLISKVLGLYDFIKESEECDQGDADADMVSMEEALACKLGQMSLTDTAEPVTPCPAQGVPEHQQKPPAAIQTAPEPLARPEIPAAPEPEPKRQADPSPTSDAVVGQVAEDLKRQNTVEIEARPVV